MEKVEHYHYLKKLFTNIIHNSLNFGIYSICEMNNKDICHVINLHLNDKIIDIRYMQMKKVYNILSSKSKCIIAGDFNHQYRKNSKLYKIPGFKVLNKNTITYFIKNNMNIDNILIKGFNGKFINLNLIHTIKFIGSDHIPVIGIIK